MNNTTRTLNQMVSVDGWIGKFDEDGLATVHTDIVFRQGKFGDAADALIRFKVALKRAEVVIRVIEKDAITIVKSSICRNTQTVAGKKTKTSSSKTRAAASILGRFSPSNLVPSANAELSVEKENESKFEMEQNLSAFLEQHFSTADGHPAWEITTNREISPYLKGAPWDALEAPRLNVKRPPNHTELPEKPSIAVEVHCSREDIEVLDLESKDESIQSKFRQNKNRKTNLAAAEQLIKEELFKAGFMDVPDLGEKHSVLLIADAIITEDY